MYKPPPFPAQTEPDFPFRKKIRQQVEPGVGGFPLGKTQECPIYAHFLKGLGGRTPRRGVPGSEVLVGKADAVREMA